MSHIAEPDAPRFSGYLAQIGFREKLSSFLFGDDVFISYSHADALDYAPALAGRLTKHKLLCYLDQYGTGVNETLPPDLVRRLKRSKVLVLIGTEGAALSDAVRDEVEIFKATGRPIIPIDVGGALARADWVKVVKNIPVSQDARPGVLEVGASRLVTETEERRRAARPGGLVVRRVTESFNYTTRNERQRRMFAAAAFILLASLGVAAWATNVAWDATHDAVLASFAAYDAGLLTDEAESRSTRAEAARAEAKRLADEAGDEALKSGALAALEGERAREAAGRAAAANAKAEEAEGRAGEAADRERAANANALEQGAMSASRAEAALALRLSAEQPDRALAQVAAAYRTRPTPEAWAGLLESLQRYPHLVGVSRPPQGSVGRVAAWPGGDVVLSLDRDGRVVFWDAARQRLIAKHEKAHDRSAGAACAGSLCATAGVGWGVNLWRLKGEAGGFVVEHLRRFDALPPRLELGPAETRPLDATLAFVKPDLLALGGVGGMFLLCDLGRPEEPCQVHRLPGRSSDPPSSLAASPDGKLLAVGFPGAVVLWEVGTPDESAKTLEYPSELGRSLSVPVPLFRSLQDTSGLAFSPDGLQLAAARRDGLVVLWDVKTGKNPVSPLMETGDRVAFVKLGDELVLAAGLTRGKLSLWRVGLALSSGLSDMQNVWSQNYRPGVYDFAVLGGEEPRVVTGGGDGSLAFWELREGPGLGRPLAGTHYANYVAFNEGGQLYIGGGLGASILEPAGGRPTPLGGREARNRFAPGEFGYMTSTWTKDSVSIFDALGLSGEFRVLGIKHGGAVATALTGDGRTLALCEGNTVALWDVSDDAAPRLLHAQPLDSRPTSVAFSQLGDSLAVGQADGSVAVLDTAQRRVVRVLSSTFAISPDDHSDASKVTSVAFSPDGKVIASSSALSHIALWDATMGWLLGSLEMERREEVNPSRLPAVSLAFGPGGKTLASASSYGVTLWNLDPEVWVRKALEIAGRR